SAMTDPGRGNGRGAETGTADRSLGELVGQLTTDTSSLLSDHIQLARVEMTSELKKAGRGAGLVGGAAGSGWVAVLLLSMALAWGLAEAMPTWLAFLIVGLIWAVVAATLAVVGRKELDEFDPKPDQTMDEIERDKQWLKRQRS